MVLLDVVEVARDAVDDAPRFLGVALCGVAAAYAPFGVVQGSRRRDEVSVFVCHVVSVFGCCARRRSRTSVSGLLDDARASASLPVRQAVRAVAPRCVLSDWRG